MPQQTPSGIVRSASTLSILWGVSLILGVLAVGSPFIAAVAVNVVIAWLIVLAGVVHLTVAFHTREAGSLIWRLLVGLAYVVFGGYLIARQKGEALVSQFHLRRLIGEKVRTLGRGGVNELGEMPVQKLAGSSVSITESEYATRPCAST
jgi:hypothetical protein